MGCSGHDCNHIHHSRGGPRSITIAFKSGFHHFAATHAGHEPSNYTASTLLANKAKELWPAEVDSCAEGCKCQHADTTEPDSTITTPEPVVVDDVYVDDPGFGHNCYWTISGIVDLTTKKWKGTCIKDGTKSLIASGDDEKEGERYEKMGVSFETIRELGLEDTMVQKFEELHTDQRGASEE